MPTFDPVVIVAAGLAYERDKVNEVFAKRILDGDELAGAIKVRYLLKALNQPDITLEQKYQIYECLIAFARPY